MHAYLVTHKPDFQSSIEHLKKEFNALRTGRATPALVEDLSVAAYGSKMEIKGLASIKIPDSRSLVIEPWDKALLQNIEKGIRDSGIGLNPIVDGQVIRVMIPQMTQESRKQIVKLLKEKMEDARIRIRGVREEVREEILKKEKANEFTEDEKFKLFDELDKLTKDYADQISELGQLKEDEIMTI